jgi:hypothetical protein
MKVRFIEAGHRYQSLPVIKWTSTTKVVEKYTNEFDDLYESERCSLNYRSKWYGIPPDEIRSLWEAENKRATDCGSWYHNLMERKALAAGKKLYRGIELPVYPPIMMLGYKLAPEQRIKEGIYPEHFMFSEDHAICGQSDLVYRYKNLVDIDDYKTNKELNFRGYGYKNGEPLMMRGPMKHLEDCNFNHYSLQLSIYMKLILLKNPDLKPGRMRIYHVTFENGGYDKFGFPILKRTPDGGYIVSGGTWHTVPYLRKEVDLIFKNCGERVGSLRVS